MMLLKTYENGGAAMSGIFFGVSVGPGDPELMTLKAVRTIERCSVITAPRTDGRNMLAFSVAAGAVDMSGKTVIPLDFPMTHDKEVLRTHRHAAACTIAEHLSRGEDTAMLNIGDISIYSTFSHIAAEIREMGFETQMCAGVPSFCASAAALGIPLTEGHEPLCVIPAQYKGAEKLIGLDGTRVIMKSGKKISEIKSMISGNSDIEAVYAAENVGLENEKLYTGLEDAVDCGYFTTIIIK